MKILNGAAFMAPCVIIRPVNDGEKYLGFVIQNRSGTKYWAKPKGLPDGTADFMVEFNFEEDWLQATDGHSLYEKERLRRSTVLEKT